jgi:hypothetical protein
LFDATHRKQEQLHAMFKKIQPSARALFRAAGLSGEPTLVDFVWAYSNYWSRALQLPDFTEEHKNSDAGGVPTITALVPGLDLVNHDSTPTAMWALDVHVAGSAGEAEGRGRWPLVSTAAADAPRTVVLFARPKQHGVPRPGAEVREHDSGGLFCSCAAVEQCCEWREREGEAIDISRWCGFQRLSSALSSALTYAVLTWTGEHRLLREEQ